jgi:hypothetical protein
MSRDGFVKAARTNLLLLDGSHAAFRKAISVYLLGERRQARRRRERQHLRELEAMSREESEAYSRELEETREAWKAGAAARAKRQTARNRWEEAVFKLSDSQIAEMRRLRELGPEAVQKSFLESLSQIVRGTFPPGEVSGTNA